MPRQIRLNAFLMPTGHHIAAWRDPQARADGARSVRHFIELAQLAERAKFDAVFISDTSGVRSQVDANLARTARSEYFEPLTLLSALAVQTQHIGLIGTVSTSFHEPYNVARKFGSLDLISEGRAGWNLVTSNGDGETENFGMSAHLDHATRYARAGEFHDVVTGLWDSWDADAFPRDKASGIYLDPARMHVLHHRGPHFSVRGPLNVSPSPQGRPVIVQAGASDAGIELAARTAEVVFVAHQELEQAQRYYARLKQAAAAHGRDPAHLCVMPGILPVVGRDAAEARAKFEALQNMIHPTVGVHLLSRLAGADLSGHPIDGPLPELPDTNGGKSRQRLLLDLARSERLSIRQTYLRIAGARGHQQVVGDPVQIADLLQRWHEEGGADGFNIMPAILPTGLQDFVELVVPELRRRGLVRQEYEGRTLRSHFGLPQPAPRRTQAAATLPAVAA